MRRAISFVWKRASISSNAATAGMRCTPCSGGNCRARAISSIVLPHDTAIASPGASSSLAISSTAGATRTCSPLRLGGGHHDHAPEAERGAERLRQAARETTGGGSRCGRSPRRARAAASATPSTATRRAAARPPAARAGRGSRARPHPSVPAQMCWTNVQTRRRVVPDKRNDSQVRTTPMPLTDTTRPTTVLTTAERRALRQIQTSGNRFAVIAADHGQPLVDMLDGLGVSSAPGGAAGVQGRSRRHDRARRQRRPARPRRVAARHRRPRRARA